MAAFAARYAQAFRDVVTARHLDHAAIDRQFNDFIATWDGSAELRQFFENPAVPSEQKVEFLDTLNKRMGLQKELRNLLALLIDHARIAQVRDVAAAYRRALDEQLGIKQAQIVTARELSQQEQSALLAEVGRLAGARIDAKFELDKSLIGGTVVRIGSTVYDGSVRGRLQRLKEELIAE